MLSGRLLEPPWPLPHASLAACRMPQETEALLEGVEACGQGSWAAIKRLGNPGLAKRSSVDLKDKWRNLRRAASVSSHHRWVGQGWVAGRAWAQDPGASRGTLWVPAWLLRGLAAPGVWSD